jgi:hypothetical protein
VIFAIDFDEIHFGPFRLNMVIAFNVLCFTLYVFLGMFRTKVVDCKIRITLLLLLFRIRTLYEYLHH